MTKRWWKRSQWPMERKLANYTPEPNTGCWLWLGTTTRTGYGMVREGPKVVLAHRAAFELKNGPIPDRLCVCHKCDVRSCINPDHLFISDHQGNMTDAMRKGRHNGCQQRGKTHCKHGHRFSEANTVIGAKGNRICRACGVVRNRLRIGWSMEKALNTPNKWAEL